MRLPSPFSLKEQLAATPGQLEFIKRSREAARKIVLGEDSRLACIIGPCSIHDFEAALEYGKRLRSLSEKLSCFLVMRVFCEKPRTRSGWKGLLYDPDFGTNDVLKGLMATRKLLLALAEHEVPCAAEFLDPLASVYYSDLITWGFIGARTSASQPHRQLASSFSFPMGFKNAIHGEVDAAIHGMAAAKESHHYLGVDEGGAIAARISGGNPYTHLVLRGSESGSNFDFHSIRSAFYHLEEENFSPRLMVDCSHGNSGKNHERQREVFESVVENFLGEGLLGIMLESHLYPGKQEAPLRYGISLTDSCIGWEETEELLLSLRSPISMNSVQK